jgi:dsRNA-specific ribonuclease
MCISIAHSLRDHISNTRNLVESKKKRAEAARAAGISGCIKLCPRNGLQDSIISLAVSAIIGATWEDCEDLETAALVMLNLG